MRMWILLLCAGILTTLAIWGCTILIEPPAQEQLTAEVSYHDFIDYHQTQ